MQGKNTIKLKEKKKEDKEEVDGMKMDDKGME
jgi:hypothetical protein